MTPADAISKDTKIKSREHLADKWNINRTEDEVWLQKASVACTQILECVKNGLTEEDGCVMAGISMSEYEDIQRRSPQLTRLIEKEKVIFKLEIMKQITESIRKGDTGKAMWMAERRFPAEYGSATKRLVTPPKDDSNPLTDIFDRIQRGEGPGSSANKEINDLQHNN